MHGEARTPAIASSAFARFQHVFWRESFCNSTNDKETVHDFTFNVHAS